MTKALPITEMAVRRAIRAAQKEGLRVVGIRTDDGTLIVDNGENPHPLVPTAPSKRSKWEVVEE